jgi:hypothetical protein
MTRVRTLLLALAVTLLAGCASTRRSQARRLNAADVAAIKDQLADLFQETFRAELARGGYALVNEPGPDTLRVTPAVVELYITAPVAGPAGSARTYVANSGRMTLVAELRDSMTGEVLARAVDTQSGRGFGTMTWTNRATNMATRAAPLESGRRRCAAAWTRCTGGRTPRRLRPLSA